MRNSQQNNARNNLFFLLSSCALSAIILAVCFFVFAHFLSGEADNFSNEHSMCINLIHAQGFKVDYNPSNHIISGNRNSRARIEEHITKLGVALAYCPQYEVETFCSGLECEIPGISFTLTPNS